MSGHGGVLRSIPFESSLRDALGDRLRVMPDACGPFAVAGVVPSAVASPRSIAKAALVLAASGAEGGVVVVRGAGTKMRRPPAPRAVDVVLDLSSIKGVVAHAPEDLTVRVRAGTTLAALDVALGEAGQFWPCDAPFAGTATVGGTIAANANGACRQRYGSIRDLVLGARFITPDGVEVETGARVVKSVAGYDIQKLLVGSWGTLGAIAEVTLKVAVRPDAERTVCARFGSPADACRAAMEIARSPIFPIATTLHDAASARRIGALQSFVDRASWTLLVRCAANRSSIGRAVDEAATHCRRAGAAAIDEADKSITERAWADVRELAGGALYATGRFASMKISSRPSDAGDVIDAARVAWPHAEITVHPAVGIAYVHVPVDPTAVDRIVIPDGAFPSKPDIAAEWLSVPDEIVAGAPGLPQPALPVKLLRAVKAALDPAGTLDPGRLPGGV